MLGDPGICARSNVQGWSTGTEETKRVFHRIQLRDVSQEVFNTNIQTQQEDFNEGR